MCLIWRFLQLHNLLLIFLENKCYVVGRKKVWKLTVCILLDGSGTHSRLYCGRSLSRWLDYDGSQTWWCGAISTLMLLSWHTSVHEFFSFSFLPPKASPACLLLVVESMLCTSCRAGRPFFHQIVWKSMFNLELKLGGSLVLLGFAELTFFV